MIEIEKPNIVTQEMSEDGRYGKFVVEPLERGFGTTLGNSLRRVLISALPGVAVVSIKIDGVLHEISTVPGVKEDVTEIVLNVKGITAKLHCDGPKTVLIDATGPCDVKAGDIKADGDPGSVKGRISKDAARPKLKLVALQWLTKVSNLYSCITTAAE